VTEVGGSDRAYLSIGEVLAQLRPEFPDTTISKLRFLEVEGLVEPERTTAGYRRYSDADVARLKYVLAAQRDLYLPLRVIREHVAALDSGQTPTWTTSEVAQAQGPDRDVPAALLDVFFSEEESPATRLKATEFLETTGLTLEQLRFLERAGVITSRSGGWYDHEAMLTARTVASLLSLGVDLAQVPVWRRIADEEVALLEGVVTPLVRQHGAQARAQADATLRELAVLSVCLHGALLQSRLRAVSSAAEESASAP
jgi:DNA-binding transcriptional MerR regulator